MTQEWAYELFISCAEADRKWVELLLIPALGVLDERIITREKFRLGTDIIVEFERAVTSSRYILLILTPSFLNDVWTSFGELITSYSRVVQQSHRLLPLILEPCQLSLRLESVISLDFTDEANYEQQFVRLRELLEQPDPILKAVSCPYPGMKPFTKDNAGYFYGREQEIDQLSLRLRKQNYFFIIGTSGSGKSSLIFAGLVPKLENKQPGQWLVKSFRPGQTASETPMQKLEKELGGESLNDFPNVELYKQLINSLLAQEHPEAKILLIIDQFEELFSPSTTREHAQLFITAIKTLRQLEKISLILAMRADFYPDLMNSQLWPLQEFERLEIAPLHGERLREAIVNPAVTCGVYVEAQLVERLLSDAGDERGLLPLLQETMVLLWGKMKQRLLTLSAYQKLGEEASKVHPSGLSVAIATHADGTLAELSKNQSEQLSKERYKIARRIFIRLVQFGEGRADTRRQQNKKELQSIKDEPQQFEYTLENLVKNRLLTPTLCDRNEDEETKIDLAHEALIESWPTFRQWLKDWHKAEKDRRRLEVKAHEWVHLGQGIGGLLDPIELAEAERWLSTPDAKELGYTLSLIDLVTASQKAIQEAERLEQERQQQARKSLKFRNAAILVSIGVTMIVGIIAWREIQTIEIRNMLSSNDPVVNLKLISKLPQLLKEAKQLSQQERKEEENRAIIDYSHILTQAKKLQKDSRASPQEQTVINKTINEAEPDLIALIKKIRIAGLLQKQFNNGMFGGRKGKIGARDTNFADLEQQFTDALQTTYKILMIDTGADVNKNGVLDNTDEVGSIPCDLLKEVEVAWRKSTQGRCGFSGKNGIISSCQHELKGQNLTVTLFTPGNRSLFNDRLQDCKIQQSNQ